MKTFYSDNHLLVVSKPAGIATQPDFEDQVKAWIKEKEKKPGNVYLHPIHRLDKPVSGLILFARTSKALSRMHAAMRERKIIKKYVAIVEGVVEPKGTLKHKLAHGDHKAFVSSDGKEAVLHYQLLETKQGNSFVEIELVTGRYHQIRVQFASIGHPIVGDLKYGSHAKKQITLHHFALTFPHPITKEKITCRCEADFFVESKKEKVSSQELPQKSPVY